MKDEYKSKLKKAIKRQIKGLESMKTWTPEYSLFGTPYHKIINAQISILNGTKRPRNFKKGNPETMNPTHEIYLAVHKANRWLKSPFESLDLFDEF